MQIRDVSSENMENRLDRRWVQEIIPNHSSTPSSIRKIGVISISRGGGATTIAYAIAEYLANKRKKERKQTERKKGLCDVSLIEVSGRSDFVGYSYDKVGIEQRFINREFISFTKLVKEGKPINGLYNVSGGINWVLKMPGDEVLKTAESICLIENVESTIKVCDIVPFRGDSELGVKMEGLKSILACMNIIICIIDPLPSRLLAGIPVFELVKMLETNGATVIYVINKMNKGVNIREVKKFLGIKDFYFISHLSGEVVYSAEFECRSIISDKGLFNEIENILHLIGMEESD